MSFLRLETFLQSFESTLYERDGIRLATFLSFSHPHVHSPRLSIESPEDDVLRFVSPPWNEIVAAHLRALWAKKSDDMEETYTCQALVVQTFTKIFDKMENENWGLPIMLTVVVDLRKIASLCSKLKLGKKENEYLEKAAELIMALFRVCASDSRSTQDCSKKWGMMGLCNQLFKIYFKINKLNLCKPMVRAIDNLGWNDKFALAQRITYDYYIGRKALFEDEFKRADASLSFAFRRCHKKSIQNKRQILIYLIPVKMLLGSFPKVFLLQKYNLMEFHGISEAVRQGNVLRLSEAMEEHEEFFIQCGIYLLLERLKMITYRNLFKKVSLILKSHILPIDAFTAILQYLEVEDIDQEETHCILANLIYEGKIKGYLSYQQQKLVISKQQAFPPVSLRA